jgi:hypothetical protein
MTDIAMGKITTVEAVLLIYIFIKAIASIKHKTTFSGALPVSLKYLNRFFYAKFTFSKANANIKPPKNNFHYLLE